MKPPSDQLRATINEQGFTLMRGAEFDLRVLGDNWNRLKEECAHPELDNYMSDGGRDRRRRYGRFFLRPAANQLKRLPHALVFQSSKINDFAGGIHRDFAPLRETTFDNPCLQALIRFDFQCFKVDEAKLADPSEVWVHQMRIETSGNNVGKPAPEGIHHDGHDYISMHFVGRSNVLGGKSRIYDNSEKELFSCMLEEPLDTLYADDHRVMHGVETICPLDTRLVAHRDILIIDFDHKPSLLETA